MCRLRTPAKAIGITLALLAEGVAPEAMQRVPSIRETTQRLWLRPEAIVPALLERGDRQAHAPDFTPNTYTT